MHSVNFNLWVGTQNKAVAMNKDALTDSTEAIRTCSIRRPTKQIISADKQVMASPEHS